MRDHRARCTAVAHPVFYAEPGAPLPLVQTPGASSPMPRPRRLFPSARPPCLFFMQVLESEYEAQRSIAPFLENRVLRRIVQSFANDPRGDFSKWALNPAVLKLLREAKRQMDEG
jgi:hypothetical protein